MNYLFSYIHSNLNSNLGEFNYRITASKHFRADDSRDLLELISLVFDLQNNLSNSMYYFEINKKYYLYLKKIKPILRSTFGTEIPNDIETIQLERYDRIFTLTVNKANYIKSSSESDSVLALVSTRNARFDEMTIDEKLGTLNEALEYLLKDKNNYISFDYKEVFNEFVTEDDVIKFRKMTHCFRHGSKENIELRTKYSEDQKLFLANYGLSICITLINCLFKK